MEHIVAALEALESEGSFWAERTMLCKALRLAVKGVGELKFPLTRPRVEDLIAVAQPAHFGRGQKTLLDKRVRNTWEIPAEQLKTAGPTWKRALEFALDDLAAGLGLPRRRDGGGLTAHLHNLLIYGPGQFFKPHQDSEKLPGMVASLIVVLPSAHEGGALLISHQGETQTLKGSPAAGELRLVAFYADCLHEIKPVRAGYRVALTYRLTFDGDADAEPGPGGFAQELEAALRRYFDSTYRAPRFLKEPAGRKSARRRPR